MVWSLVIVHVLPLKVVFLPSLRVEDREPVPTVVPVWVVGHRRKWVVGGEKEGRKELELVQLEERGRNEAGAKRVKNSVLQLFALPQDPKASANRHEVV